jgi:hypothetical protein
MNRLPLLLVLIVSGCASSVEVTKLTPESYPASQPAQVEILKIKPDKPYAQIADVSAMQFPNSQSERRYAEMRAKAAKVGADAILITSEQTFRRDFVLYRSVTGVALKWK